MHVELYLCRTGSVTMKDGSKFFETDAVFDVQIILSTLQSIVSISPIDNPSTMGGKAQVLRDMRKRLSADQMEVQRRAFLYIARNASLSSTIRHKAQLGLNALNGGEGRMTAVKNRCVETGRGRGKRIILLHIRQDADGDRNHVEIWALEGR